MYHTEWLQLDRIPLIHPRVCPVKIQYDDVPIHKGIRKVGTVADIFRRHFIDSHPERQLILGTLRIYLGVMVSRSLFAVATLRGIPLVTGRS